MIKDPDILKSELVFLNAKEKELLFELEEVRATIAVYQNELEVMEETL